MLKWMLQRSIQSVWKVDWNGCWNVASTAFSSCLKWMLQRSIQNVFEVDSNECYNVASRASWNWLPGRVASWLKWMLQRKLQRLGVAWKRFSNITLEHDSLRWKRSFRGSENYCACHTKAGVTFAPTLGSHSPLPPTEVGANATPHEVGANATPMPYMIIAILDYWHEINHPASLAASLAASLGYPHDKTNTFKVVFQFS